MSNGNTYLSQAEVDRNEEYKRQLRELERRKMQDPVVDEDESSWLTDFAGNILWGGTSAASWGALDVASLTETGKVGRSALSLGTYRPWEEQTGAGKAGFIVGQGVGMFATFSWTGKGLGLISRALTKKPTGRIATDIARKAGDEALDKYGEKKGIDALTKFGDKLLKGEVDDLAMEGIERGTLESMREASRIVNSPGYKRIWKFNQEAYSNALDDMTRYLITEMPDIGTDAAMKLSDNFISSAMKYSTHQFHNYMDSVVGLIAQGASKLPGAMGRGSQWTLTGRTGRIMSAMASDFALGIVHHGAQAAIENATFKTGEYFGAEYDDKELRHYENLNSGFMDVVTHSAQSGLWMSLIAPTRFIRGGRREKLHKEAWNGLKTLTKAWKPADRMNANQARMTLQYIDDVSEGSLKKNILSKELAGKEIENLTKEEAVSMLKKVRKQFSSEWMSYMTKEIRQDLTGSAGRMVAGAIAMNLPAMKDYYDQTGKLDPIGSLGSDPSEIVSNMIVGMLFAKSGRTFGDAKTSNRQSRLFETGEIKQYYTGNIKKIKAIRAGLEMIGYKSNGHPLDINSAPVELRGRYLVNTGEYKLVDDVLKDYFVSAEDSPVIEKARPLDTAYESAADMTNPVNKGKLDIAKRVIGHYDNNATDIGNVMRHVTPREAIDIVERINNIPGIKEHKFFPEVWLKKAELNAAWRANERFYDLQLGNIRMFHESIGDTAFSYDPTTGKFRVSEVNLQRLFGDRPSEILNDFKNTYEKFIDEGIKSGDVIIEGRIDRKSLTPNELKAIEKEYSGFRSLMNESIYGKDSMMYENGIMHDKDMWEVYKVVKADIDIGNTLRMMTNVQKDKLFTNLAEIDVSELQKQIDSLQLNRKRIPEVADIEKPMTEVEQKRFDELTKFYARIQNVYNVLTGNKDLNVSNNKPITMDTISIAKENIENKLGDVFTNDAVYDRLLNQSVNHMINTIDIQSIGRDQQLKHSLTVMMNGGVGPSGTAIGDLNKYGGLVVRRNDQINIPDKTQLFQLLKQSPDLQGENLDVLGKFYSDFQAGMSAASGPINITKDINVISDLIKSVGGPSNVRTILQQAKIFSDVGHIKDLHNGYENLTDFMNKIQNDKDIYFQDYSQMSDFDANVNTNLRNLVNDMGTLRANIKHLLDSHDYKALIDIKLAENADTMKSLERFKEMDLADLIDKDTGSIVSAKYKQELVNVIEKTKEMLSNKVLDQENISSYVNEQINKSKYDLLHREHVLRLNTTPQKFESDYGLDTIQQEIIINEALNNRTASSNKLTNKDIIRTVENLHSEAVKAIGRRFFETGKVQETYTNEQIYYDAWQLVSSKVFSDKIKRVKYIGGYEGGRLVSDEVPYPIQSSNDGRGVTGLKNILFNNGEGMYVLQPDMKFLRQGDAIAKDLVILDKDVMNTIDSQIENGIGIDSKTTRNEYYRKKLDRRLEEEIIATKVPMVRVVLTDRTQLLVSKDLAQTSIARAFAEGGPLSDIVRILFKGDRKAADNYLEQFRTNDMSVNLLKTGINEAWNILNMPHLIIGEKGGLDRQVELDLMKRRKLADISKGKILNDRMQSALVDFYNLVSKETNSPLAKELLKAYSDIRDPKTGKLLPRKSLSINDSVDELSVLSRYKKKLDSYDKDIMMGLDRDTLLREVEPISKEAPDSATYVTRKEFLRYLGLFAPNRELIQFNKQGKVIGFEVGALKPKGVHVSVKEDGSISVSYDKTAIFYDPKIGKMLENADIHEVRFRSGNKINVSRKGTNKLSENYVEPIIRQAGKNAESIEQMIQWTIEGSKSDAVEIPRSSYDFTQASVPHAGSAGANTGVHYSNRSGIQDWTQIGKRLNEFNELLLRAAESPEALTALARQLSDAKRKEGDLNPARTPLDAFIDSQGLVASDWMGDMVVDNLFTHYFTGSKIASTEVKGSSYSPMAPMLADKNVDSPLIYTDQADVGRQRIYGGFEINKDIADMPFKPLGRITESDPNTNVTGFFISRHKFANPAIEGRASKSEIIIIPNEKKGFTAIVEGMELRKDGSLKDAIGSPISKLSSDQLKINSDLYKEIESNVKDLREYWDKEKPSNEMVLDKLAKTDNMWMGILNLRQPRNGYDVVINKIHRENLGSKDKPNWKHYDERKGNSTRQNSLDVLRQDADHDFDKSNVYSTAPKDFIKEVASMAGAKIKNDPVDYADLIIKNLEINVRDQATLSEWFKDVNNTSALRGRFVKMHQIATYLSNILGENGTLGTLQINNKRHAIRMKSRKEYVEVVGDISKVVKYFLDNYKDIVDVRTQEGFTPGIDRFVRDILFGKENKVNGEVVSVFEGLFKFETVGQKKDIQTKVLNDNVGGDQLAEVLYNRIVGPLNRYLSYNRGELTQADIKSKLRLKDISLGMSDFRDAFYIPKGQSADLIPIGEIKLDLSPGKKRIYDFIHTATQNPFDIAMTSLSSAYDNALKVKRYAGHNKTDVESLISEGETKTLRGEASEYLSVSNEILKTVKNEGSLARLSIVSDRLSSLSGELARLQSNQYSNKYDVDQIAKRVEYYGNLKKELELYIASKISLERNDNVFTFKKGQKRGRVKAFNEDWVVWDSGGKNIKQVIRKDNFNEIDVKKGDIIVRGGRKFEFSPPKRQDRLREKWIAYGKPMLEMATGDGRMVAMDRIEYDGSVVPAYLDFSSEYRKISKEWSVHRDGERLSTERKALLDMFLNDLNNRYGLNDQLKRRAFIFKLLTPEIDQSTFIVRENKGKHFYDFKFTENEKISKTVYGYLTDVKLGESFSRDNVMSKMEANNLIQELSRKASLAHYGLTDPYASVDIAFTRTPEYLSKVSRRLIDIDRNVLRPSNIVRGKEHEFNSAIGMINQFINGDRLITPFDMVRISRKIIGDRGGVSMFTVGESGNSNPVLIRKAGTKGSEPKRTVDQLLYDRKQRQTQCGKGRL